MTLKADFFDFLFFIKNHFPILISFCSLFVSIYSCGFFRSFDAKVYIGYKNTFPMQDKFRIYVDLNFFNLGNRPFIFDSVAMSFFNEKKSFTIYSDIVGFVIDKKSVFKSTPYFEVDLNSFCNGIDDFDSHLTIFIFDEKGGKFSISKLFVSLNISFNYEVRTISVSKIHLNDGVFSFPKKANKNINIDVSYINKSMGS